MSASKPTNERGVIELVEAIIDDTRELVGAHVEALRDDMSGRLANLGSTVASSLLAFSILIVTAVLLGISLATTLIAIGLPTWASFWIVTLFAAGVGVVFVRRAKRTARDASRAATDAAARVKNDVAWISDERQQLAAAKEA